jgi:hypothetical protein
MHHLYKDAILNGLERKDAIKKWRCYFETEISNNSEIIVITNYTWWANRGYPAIQLFYNSLESFDIKEIIAVEQKMSGEFDGEGFNFICDIIYKNSKGEKILLDYKTGREKAVDYYQMAFYDGRFDQVCDKLCLFYIWSGPIWFSRSEHEEKSNSFVRAGLKIAKSGQYERVINKYCKTCMFYKDDCSKVAE